MKPACWILFASLVGCGSRPPAQAPGGTAATGAEESRSSAAPPEGAPPPAPIAREEIARELVPSTVEEARRLLVGRWEGKHYEYDSEHGFSGDEGDAPHETIELGGKGQYRMMTEGCETLGRYEVESDESGLTLRLFRERDCAGDPPYDYPSSIHRVDDELLVLVDGMTAATSAYRRAR